MQSTLAVVLRKLARRGLEAIGPEQIEEAQIFLDFLDAEPGVLLEVGAHQGDGVFLEFAASDWTIHAFEPDPGNREILDEAVNGLANVTVVPKAVSDKPGTLTLYRLEESTGASSLAPFTERHQAALEVEVITLADYMATSGLGSVDFLKLDIEGFEKFALVGFPWETHRPRAILLEFDDTKTVPLGYGWRDLAEALQGRGYAVLVSEWLPIERYGVAHTWRRFAAYPAVLADPKAWGNLLAVEPSEFARLERLARRLARRFHRRTRIKRWIGR